jgi:hypothetical protein
MKNKQTTLYCFSPPVMIATFVIETALMIYTFVRYKLTPITRLAGVLLICLAIFQLAEYNVCEGSWGVNSLQWARIGYVAITLLPPIGIHLASRIAGQRAGFLTSLAYGSSVLFAVFFLVIGQGMQSEQCLGNYVIFTIAPGALVPYTLYYYGWLAITTVYSFVMSLQLKERLTAHALRWLAVGYLAFIIPTTAVNLIDPTTRAGIPSIMCGFAVLLALILSFRVLPQSTEAQSFHKKLTI